METDEFFTTKEKRFTLLALPQTVATFRRNPPEGGLQKAENTSCQLYTEQPYTAGYIRAESRHQRYANGCHRGGRNWHEARLHSGTHAATTPCAAVLAPPKK